MPGIDLSTLTAPELRQLLRIAQGRRDGLLIDRVQWEIAQRKALESRAGLDLQRKAAVVIEDGDVTIDEVRAFRRPDGGLPVRRQPSGRLAAMLGGLVAGSAMTAGAFAAAGNGWQMPRTIDIPALPLITVADRAPEPVTKPQVVPAATSDAVAGVLAPEPFPEPAPPPPPPPPPMEVAEVAPPPPIVEPPKPEPKAETPKPRPEKAPKPKPKTELAKKKPDAKAKAATAAKRPSDKTKLAAKKDAKPKVVAKAKPKTDAKTQLATKPKPKTTTKTATAKAETKKTPAKTAPKSAVAAKTTKPKPPPAKTPAKPKVQAAATGEARDTIGTILEASAAAPPTP